MMFWDKFASLYDFFEKIYNGKCYNALGERVAEFVEPTDKILECACGTGAISQSVAKYCYALTATDTSEGMMKRARKKCRKLKNVRFRKADIMELEYRDGAFDTIIAGNVIHLLDEPKKALTELERVCKKDGKLIIPTYLCKEFNSQPAFAVRFLKMIGLDFKAQFTFEGYKQFFEDMGYTNVTYSVVDGRMPCAIAVIQLNKQK